MYIDLHRPVAAGVRSDLSDRFSTTLVSFLASSHLARATATASTTNNYKTEITYEYMPT